MHNSAIGKKYNIPNDTVEIINVLEFSIVVKSLINDATYAITHREWEQMSHIPNTVQELKLDVKVKVGQIYRLANCNDGFEVTVIDRNNVGVKPLPTNQNQKYLREVFSLFELNRNIQLGILILDSKAFSLNSHRYKLGDQFNFPIDEEGNQRIFTLLGVNAITYFTDPKWQYFLASTNNDAIYMYEKDLDQWAQYKL